MATMDRIKGMLLAPKAEWPKVAAEPATVQSLYTGWIMILGLIGPIAILVLLGFVSGGFGLSAAIASYVNTLVGIAIIALIADLIAPTFGGTRDYVASLKLVAYAATAVWIAQIALVVPILGALVVLVGAIYSVYLTFLGAPVLHKCTADKAVAYTIVLLLCAIVIGYLISKILYAMLGNPMGMGAPKLGGF
jgi:Yip1-like protein